MPHRSRPQDFDDYWRRVRRELDETAIASEQEHVPIRSTEFCDCYLVRFTSIGPYRLFGYLSIPHGDGPFPAILAGPRYRSVVELLFQGEANEKRSRFVMFSTAGRGQRHADEPFAAEYPGLVTEGIDSPESYIYRGIVADWARAADYLLARPEVDRGRVTAVSRDSLPIVAAALRPELTHVVAQPGSFFQVTDKASGELDDYLRMFPDKRDLVERTLSYFDPLHFAPAVRARTLLWGDPATLGPLSGSIAGETDIQPTDPSQYKEGVFEECWLSEQLGFAEPILPRCWQR
ncbi:MAG: acetylxylan esterase [Acidobacteria bacterium]|nr:acetylxylan esterase [Acidobacteriota bacterium]